MGAKRGGGAFSLLRVFHDDALHKILADENSLSSDVA